MVFWPFLKLEISVTGTVTSASRALMGYIVTMADSWDTELPGSTPTLDTMPSIGLTIFRLEGYRPSSTPSTVSNSFWPRRT